MTDAPATLKAVRSLLLEHLDNLDPAAVGIVGDSAHRGGYHCGSDRLDLDDYSVRESTRDRNGLTLDSCALDVGTFSYGSHNLRTFSAWLVAQCVAGAPDTRDIREIIYSSDGKTVRRWDRLGLRSSGDSSHLWHTHLSFHRDGIKAKRDQTPLFRRYLAAIGLLEDDMELTAANLDAIARHVWTWDLLNGDGEDPAYRVLNRAALLAGQDTADEGAIVAGILAQLTPAKIAAAIPATQAQAVADEIARRMNGGTVVTPR